MSSAMRSRHLKKLGGAYGCGRFKGSDGEGHARIERMSLIRGYKEAVVIPSTSSTIPETMMMVRRVAGVTSASPLPPTKGAVSPAREVVMPVLEVDQIGTYSRTSLSRTSLSQIFRCPGRFFEIFSSYIEIYLTVPDFGGFRTG